MTQHRTVICWDRGALCCAVLKRKGEQVYPLAVNQRQTQRGAGLSLPTHHEKSDGPYHLAT
jgi:hypothetical protein